MLLLLLFRGVKMNAFCAGKKTWRFAVTAPKTLAVSFQAHRRTLKKKWKKTRFPTDLRRRPCPSSIVSPHQPPPADPLFSLQGGSAPPPPVPSPRSFRRSINERFLFLPLVRRPLPRPSAGPPAERGEGGGTAMAAGAVVTGRPWRRRGGACFLHTLIGFLAPFPSPLVGRHSHRDRPLYSATFPLAREGKPRILVGSLPPRGRRAVIGTAGGREGRLPDVRRRRRRAMELGGGGPAAGPGQGALGRGGLEFLQHTGEGPPGPGASRAEGRRGRGWRGWGEPGGLACPLRRGAGSCPGVLPLSRLLAGWAPSPSPAACSHLRLVPVSAGSLLSSYGWYILLAAVAIYLLIQKISQSLAARPSSQPGAADAAVGE